MGGQAGKGAQTWNQSLTESSPLHLQLSPCTATGLPHCASTLLQGGTAKLADVGLSRLQKGTYLSDVPLIGTFAWIAPEILVGSKQCTSAVDIYRCVRQQQQQPCLPVQMRMASLPCRSAAPLCSAKQPSISNQLVVAALGPVLALLCCPWRPPAPPLHQHRALPAPCMQPGSGDVGGEPLCWAVLLHHQPAWTRMLCCRRWLPLQM